jgi:hypothetical protein
MCDPCKKISLNMIIVYIEYTGVSAPSSELCPLPSPARPPQASVLPPLYSKGGGDNTRLPAKGWRDPIRTAGRKAWHSVYFVATSGMQYPCYAASYLHGCNSDMLLILGMGGGGGGNIRVKTILIFFTK